MLLTRNMVGELLNRRVEKLNGEQNQNDADHGDIPDGAWRQHETQQHGDEFLVALNSRFKGKSAMSGMAATERRSLYVAGPQCASACSVLSNNAVIPMLCAKD